MAMIPSKLQSSLYSLWDTSAASSPAMTIVEQLSAPPAMATMRTHLEEEALHNEEAFEKYGGDNIHDPSPKREFLILETSTKVSSDSATTDPDEVTWDGPDDLDNPQNWSDRYKWFVTILGLIMALNMMFASSAPMLAVVHITREFDVSAEVTYLLMTVFLLGFTFGPLLWGPGSELVGRQLIFIIAMVFYTLFHIGQALVPNIETLLITRFISGFFAVAPLTNCGGMIADIWSAGGRGQATSVFTATTFLGPVTGPIVSGYIVLSSLSWRWVFWVMMIFAGCVTIFVSILLPETYALVILAKKVKKIWKSDLSKAQVFTEHEKQDWSIKGLAHRTIYCPFHMLALEPILVLLTIYISLVYGILYALIVFEAFPVIFIHKRGFTIQQDGLIFIGVGIGMTLGSLINYLFTRHYPELIKKWRGFPPAEHRLYGVMVGGPALVVGAFWLGWTGEYSSIPWHVPGLSTIIIGMSINLIFMSFLTYLVDTYLMYSASAFAANTIIRSGIAAAFPLFTVQMFTKLGINWASTLLGLIALVLAPSPFLFYKYGSRIRMRSKFAPCVDLKIAKILKEEELSRKDVV